MRKSPIKLLLIGFLLTGFSGFANNVHSNHANYKYSKEDRIIKGVVLDENGFPINEALVETNNGVITYTDYNGEFEINAGDNIETLKISFLGYKEKIIQVDEKDYYEVQLELGSIALSEVVVTGYSKENRRNITAAISSVDPDEIKALPKSDVTEMLEGKLAGVQIMSDNSPGGGNSIRVRGFSTINSNDPLVIIDGVPVNNGLNSINPNDIESIQVLKDGASASIYGARAANGVVIITTKNGGSSDEVHLSFDAYAGVQNAFNLPKMLSAQQYGDLLWQAAENDGINISNDIYGNGSSPVIPQWLNDEKTLASSNTDWVDAIFDQAVIQSYNLGLKKGGKKSKQFFGIGYLNQEGIIKHTGFERFQARLNSDYKIGEIVTIGENLNASLTKNVNITTNSSLGSVVHEAMQFPSIVPIKDNNGAYGGNPLNDINNPLGRLERNKDNERKNLRLIGNVFARAEYSDFVFNTSLGIDFENSNYRGFNPKYDEILSSNNKNSLSTSNSFNYQLTWTNTLNYTKKLNTHYFDVLIGQESVQYYSEGFNASRQNFLYEDPNFWFLNYGTENQLNSGDAYEWKLNSIFGKLHYNYLEKYLITATIRRDGTSRLANNKYGTFPAFSAGWRVDKEEFFENDVVSSFMLRVGWGQTGNQEIPSYSTIESYVSNSSNSNYDINGTQTSVVTGLTPSRIANPDLKWETTTQTSVGLDLGFFDNSLSITADFYNKVTNDILVYTSVPLTYGGTNDGMWVNDGKMKNIGFELLANYKNKINELDYNVGFNFSTYKNELVNLNSVDYLAIPSSTLHVINFDQEVSRSAVGEPIGSFYGYVADGLFNTQEEVNTHQIQPKAQPGDIRFKDLNNDGVLNDDDRTFIGSPHPDFTLGLNLNLKYKNFDLGLFFNGSFGNDIYNLTKYKLYFFNQSAYNKSNELLNAWTPNNQNTDIPRLSLDDPNNNIRPSSYYVEDGSYFKLNNLNLGYTINNLLNVNTSLRIYGQVTNVFTITDYSGLTPQIGLQNYSSQNRNLDIGIDRGLYPPARTYTLGLNFNF